jgi:hypothetical protein
MLLKTILKYRKNVLFISFEVQLSRAGQEQRLLEITHFVNLFADALAQLKYSDKSKKEFEKNRVTFERNKMERTKREELEDRERREFIEQWKLKNKLKGKKPSEKKKILKNFSKEMAELEDY